MHLRHIRPRSVDWYDATFEEGTRGFERLSPEEKTKLRRMSEAGELVMNPMAPVTALLARVRRPAQSAPRLAVVGRSTV
jgi:hypothetical protein